MPDIAVILVNLGIVALLVGVAVVWNRARFAYDRTSFRCRVALVGPGSTAVDHVRWSRLGTRAKWTGELLLIQIGPLWTGTLTVAARLPITSSIREQGPAVVGRLGAHPQTLVVRDHGDNAVVLGVRQNDRMRLVGPFLAAAVTGLPSTTRTHRKPRR
jgi:hypothetical protein